MAAICDMAIIKLIINQHLQFLYFFYFIKSQTSDSFVIYFDGHFAYLKTLDFLLERAPEH